MSSSSPRADGGRTDGAPLRWRRDPSAFGALWSRVGGPGHPASHTAPGDSRDEPPLVLVHGLVISSRYMVPVAERLATTHQVLAPDLPGFGRSDGPPRALTIPALASALAAWMRALALPPAVLVGNSLGCQVSLELAAASPELVRGLVLAGPTFDPDAGGTAEHMARLALDATRERLSLIPAQAVDLARAGIGRGWRTYRHARAHAIAPLLPAIACPTLVVRGARDPLVSRAWTERIARGIAGGRSAEIPDAPHAVNYSAPAALATLVRAFLRDVLT